ncbi:mechanosensitive ion channel [bacterium]|nr:mechanosensitive ion channel [bacterium]
MITTRTWLVMATLLILTRWVGLCQPIPTPVASASEGNPSPTPVLTEVAAPATPPIGLTEMASSLESSRSQLDSIESNLNQDSTPRDIDRGLAALSDKVSQRSPETRLKLAQDLTTSELRDLENDWKNLSQPIADWRKRLNGRAGDLDKSQQALKELNVTWQAAQNLELPPALVAEMQKLVVRMDAAREKIRADRDKMLVVLDRLNTVDNQIKSTLSLISTARDELVKRIFVQDSSAIWKADFSHLSSRNLVLFTLDSWDKQLEDLSHYFSEHLERFLFHLLCFGLSYLALSWADKRVQVWVEVEPSLQRPAQAFRHPVPTALLLAYLLSPLIYPQQPIMLQALLGATALFPASLVLSRLLDPYYVKTFKLAIVIFLVDRIRETAESQLLLSRIILTGEMTVILVFLAWRIVTSAKDTSNMWVRPVIAGHFALAWFALNLGFVNLGSLVGKAGLSSIYLAILLLALVQIVDGLILLALRTPPLSLFASVRNHRPLYRDQLRRGSRRLARLVWFLMSLSYLALLNPLWTWLSALLAATGHVGALSVSLGGVLALVLSVAIPYQLSRILRFQLEQDVYPRLGLTLGQTYTISTTLHYLLLITGSLFGLAAVGVDTTKFAVVAGALSVGIGFGLQNIVNNFVSGLILLFERPIEVGHVIEVTGQVGTLQHIGLRASVLRTPDGSDVIVPNGELLSTKVTNWTLRDQRRLVRVDVSVSYGSNPSQVQAMLLRLAGEHPDVCAEPPPQVVLVALADSALNFQLQAWTEKAIGWMGIRSDLLISAYEALNQAGIEIPFPQRTIHVVSRPDEL